MRFLSSLVSPRAATLCNRLDDLSPSTGFSGAEICLQLKAHLAYKESFSLEYPNRRPPVNQRLLAEIGRTHRLEILNTLKRTRGLSVNQLVVKMKMSYMGIKQHCLTLEHDGYLDTWRRPQKMGRPEMVYRLTRRSHGLFQADSNAFTLALLQSIAEIHGPNAPEKLLYSLFERKTHELKEKIKGSTIEERAKSLAAIRDEEGHMSQFVNEPTEGGPQILECHSPIMNLIESYEIIGWLEQNMFEKLLLTPVRREETRTSGLYEAAFYFAI
jgi:predicted ArsR family transcriptional regulator